MRGLLRLAWPLTNALICLALAALLGGELLSADYVVSKRVAARQAQAAASQKPVLLYNPEVQLLQTRWFGTPAIYRRWPTKSAMAIDIVERESRPDPITDTGSIRYDLVEFVKARIRMFSRPLFHQVLLPVVMEASGDPRLSDEIRRRFAEYRRPAVEARLHKAITTGELRADTDPGRLIDLLMGTIAMPLLFSQDLPDESEARAIVDQVLDGFAAKV